MNNGILQQAEFFFQAGKLNDAEKLLVSLLSGDINNPEYRKLGEKILKAKQKKRHQEIARPRKNPKTISIESFKCPNCGSNIDVFSKESESVSCKKCNAVIDLESDSLAFFLNTHYKRKPGYQSFLRLGHILKYNGKRYQLIGRSRKKITGKGWETDDNTYKPYSWVYDEWVLQGAKKEILYLTEDSEGFHISKSFIPKKPEIPTPQQTHMNLKGGFWSQRITERGKIQNLFIEGEFPWRIQKNDIVEFAETAKQEGKVSSVEWRNNLKSKVREEVEFFETTPIDTLDILMNIQESSDPSGIIKSTKATLGKQLQTAKENRKWGWIFLGIALFGLLCSAFSSGNGNKIFSKSFSPDSLQIEGESLLGPIPLEKKDEIYSIQIKSNVSGSNDWNWAGVSLLNQKKQIVGQVTGVFWSESGYDEGYWAESYDTTTLIFYIENPGEYYLALSGETGTISNSIFSVIVYEKTPLSRYYIITAILASLAAVTLFMMNQTSQVIQNISPKKTRKLAGENFLISIVICMMIAWAFLTLTPS